LEWLIVDDGSTDGTRDYVEELAGRLSWVRVLKLDTADAPARGGPVVRSFMIGAAALETRPEVVVKMDADVTFETDYFERLLATFASNPRLGIASGLCYEVEEGAWRPIFGTRSHVWGAIRAYHRQCLERVSPLDQREGWDELDALRARLEGWETRLIADLPFRHHRRMGNRDGRSTVWLKQGETAHYMDYRFSYLLARTAYRVVREPRAALMLVGWTRAALRREPRVRDVRVREYLRDQQRIRHLPLRLREARGVLQH
jgi:GT2 family glycosyltransferase